MLNLLKKQNLYKNRVSSTYQAAGVEVERNENCKRGKISQRIISPAKNEAKNILEMMNCTLKNILCIQDI